MDCGGYAGKVIEVDLTKETTCEYPWNAAERERYLGGKAMAARILRDHLTETETAFSEENRVVISTGPLTGTGAPGSARFDIAALSPRDDLPAFSNCGGDFGIYLKKAGYDALILTGRCKERRWLEISGDKITFHDAGELWGSGTGLCQEKLTDLLGTDRFGRLCIGPAGENLVRFASVVSDGHSAGRAGIGAVLGWKNLKAVTVCANKRIPVSQPEKMLSLNRAWHEHLRRQGQRQEPGKSCCTGCPLHCSRHNRGEDARLNELGMDAIAAADAADWALEQGFITDDIWEAIAHRRGIGDKLAEGVSGGKGKGGKRRGGSYQAIARAFDLPADSPETEAFCRALTEAVSAAGQCIFTVSALQPRTETAPDLYVLKMLEIVTGMEMSLERFIRIGDCFLDMEQQLRNK